MHDVVRKRPHVEDLRVAWFAAPFPIVVRTGWGLTIDGVAKAPVGIDLPMLLDTIEAQLREAAELVRGKDSK
ncbi:hypothetical protein [Arthrobacter sp. HLT1-20]